MILVSILVTTALITVTHSTPLSYAMYKKRESYLDHSNLMSLLGQKDPRFENEMYNDNMNSGSSVRNKRIGSLSIINSVDVLRDRVLLELARRKALQNRLQIAENRRFLDTIGKRSIPDYEESYATYIGRANDSGARQQKTNPDENTMTERTRVWVVEDDPAASHNHVEQVQRLQKSEQHLL